MKKIFSILAILIFYLNSNGQSIVPRANSSYTVQDSRFSAALNLFVPRYADTTAANAGTAEGIDTLGAIIYTYDVQALWVRRYDSGKKWAAIGGGGGGSGTVTSVGWTGGIVSIANPTTTPAFTIAGTSGGIPYFSSSSTWATSAALAANSLVIGGGAGVAPSSITTGTGILTALGVNIGSAGAPVLFDGAGGTPSSMVGTNITGTASGLSIGGNAATATILQTARNIQGVSFNGSAAIDIINGTGFVKATGTTLSYDNSTYVTSNIYTADGTLAGARAVALNGNTLSINQGANSFLSIDPTAGAETIRIRGLNTTAGDNYGEMLARATNTNGEAQLRADFDNDTQAGQINILADNTGSFITHSATTHQFTGNVGIGVAPTVLFQVQSGGNNFLSIDPTAGTEVVTFQAYNITTDDNYARFQASTINTGAQSIVRADFNNGANDAQIEVLAVSGSATINYTALQGHTFEGSIFSTDDNTYDIGSSSAAFQDIYGRILHLDGSTSGEVTFQSDALGNTGTSTTLSGTGYVGATMFVRPTSDFTLQNSNTDQTAFGASLDVWTLQASTTYWVEGEYIITSGATSHAFSIGFTLGGGASVTSISYSAISWPVAINSTTATQTTTLIQQTASTAVNLAGAFAVQYVKFSGHISVNAGGTFTPIIKFSADPTGTCLMKAGSYIKFTPIGTDAVQSLGNVN